MDTAVMVPVVPVERGCGRRTKGGAYWECECGPGGVEWMFDPPIPVPPGMKVPARGVAVIEHDGVTHLVDRIGLEFYPNVCDFVEEILRFGISRRLPKSLPFEKLSTESRLICVHDRAAVLNLADYGEWECPRGKPEHRPEAHPQMCAGLWWRDVVGGEPVGEGGLEVRRKMPSFEYRACRRPPTCMPIYVQAIFASFPCSRIAVVAGNGHEATLEAVRRSKLPVEVVER